MDTFGHNLFAGIIACHITFWIVRKLGSFAERRMVYILVLHTHTSQGKLCMQTWLQNNAHSSSIWWRLLNICTVGREVCFEAVHFIDYIIVYLKLLIEMSHRNCIQSFCHPT